MFWKKACDLGVLGDRLAMASQPPIKWQRPSLGEEILEQTAQPEGRPMMIGEVEALKDGGLLYVYPPWN